MRFLRPTLLVLGMTAACLLPSLPAAQASVPLGGLAVAATPDGARLVAGGDSRAIYELDPQSLAVKRRVHLGRAIVALVFSPDGKRLWAESTKAVQMLDGTSFEVLKTFENFEYLRAAPAAGLVAVQDRRGGQIRMLALADGAERHAVAYDRMKSLAGFGLRPDGKQLALLYTRKQSKDEPKVGHRDVPKELKGAARNEFKQRNDGYRSRYVVHDVATGKTLLDKQLWYGQSGGGRLLCWHGDAVHVLAYDNQNARIDAEGNVTYFELGNSFNYGVGISADGSTVLSGGLRDGARTTLPDRAAAKFRLDKLPGFPEYFKSFCVTQDGTAFGGTSCWRVARIDAKGKIVKTVPIY